MFVHLRDAEQADEETDEAMRRARRRGPPDDHAGRRTARTDLGRMFFLSEFAVAVAGWALEINPFDQPNVQEAKDDTKRVLDVRLDPLAARGRRRCAARAARQTPSRRSYMAIMGYLPYSDELDAAVAELARR